MGKAVQHIHSLTNFMNGQSIILLVKEKAGFLPFLHINDIFYAVFHICTLVSKGSLRKPFQGCMPSCLRTFASLRSYTPRIWMPSSSIASMSRRRIVSFMRSIPIARDCTTSTSENLIHNQTGQKIRFPENNTAGGNIHRPFAVIPCRLYSGAQKCLIQSPHPYFCSSYEW